MPKKSGAPKHHERCVEMVPQGRCTAFRLPDSDRCILHERRMRITTPVGKPIEPEIDHGDAELRLYQDPIYAERVRAWLADPTKLLDWRHTMARTQALADMLEDRVRRMGMSGDVPPPLLYAIEQLRKMHLAIQRLESTADETKFIHVSIVDSLIGNMVAVLTEYVPAERVPAALDKLGSLQAQFIPGGMMPPPRGPEPAKPKPNGHDAPIMDADEVRMPEDPADDMEPDE